LVVRRAVPKQAAASVRFTTIGYPEYSRAVNIQKSKDQFLVTMVHVNFISGGALVLLYDVTNVNRNYSPVVTACASSLQNII
jgi:hypothetical protein